MKNDEGVSTLEWINNSKHPSWILFGICVAVFFSGYFVGEHRAIKKGEVKLKEMIRTNTIHIGYDIPLGLTLEKQEAILDAMEEATMERESESAFEMRAQGRR